MNKAIGLPFKAELVPKVLDGTKTVTRRIPGIHNCRLVTKDGKDKTGRMKGLDWNKVMPGYHCEYSLATYDAECARFYAVFHPEDECYYYLVPRYKPGDIAWMREKHYFTILGEVPSIHYAAGNILMEDANEYASGMSDEEFDRTFAKGDGKWRPGIHMPRKVSRWERPLKSVRIELIQDISEEDALAEGVDYLFTQEQCDTTAGIIGTKPEDHGFKNYLWHGHQELTASQIDAWPYQFSGYDSARDSFSSLWELINAKRGWGWGLNKPVVVYQW